MITTGDMKYLKRSVVLAKKALENGDQPFGSVLVSKTGEVLYEGHNHVKDGDHTRHPEFEIAKWALNNLSLEERQDATVYTSGEHCPMCAAAHGWANLGRIVYASSSKQLSMWLKEFGVEPSRVKPLPIEDVIDGVLVDGPVHELAHQVYLLQKQYWLNKS